MGSYEIRETKERLIGIDLGGKDETVETVMLPKATFDQAREALKSLSNEVSALLGLQEEELRDLVGHANVGCLKERLRQARESLSAMEAL